MSKKKLRPRESNKYWDKQPKGKSIIVEELNLPESMNWAAKVKAVDSFCEKHQGKWCETVENIPNDPTNPKNHCETERYSPFYKLIGKRERNFGWLKRYGPVFCLYEFKNGKGNMRQVHIQFLAAIRIYSQKPKEQKVLKLQEIVLFGFSTPDHEYLLA